MAPQPSPASPTCLSPCQGWISSSAPQPCASAPCRTLGWARCAVLTTFIQLQLSLQLGQGELTSASNARRGCSQQSCPRPPRRLQLWPEIFFHPCPTQLKRKNVTAVWKLLHLPILDKLLANRLFCAFGESRISAELVKWLLSFL